MIGLLRKDDAQGDPICTYKIGIYRKGGAQSPQWTSWKDSYAGKTQKSLDSQEVSKQGMERGERSSSHPRLKMLRRSAESPGMKGEQEVRYFHGQRVWNCWRCKLFSDTLYSHRS